MHPFYYSTLVTLHRDLTRLLDVIARSPMTTTARGAVEAMRGVVGRVGEVLAEHEKEQAR